MKSGMPIIKKAKEYKGKKIKGRNRKKRKNNFLGSINVIMKF